MNSSNVLKIYKNNELEGVVTIDKIKALRGSSLFYQSAIIIGDQNVNIGLNCTVEELFAIISSDSENKEYRYYTEDYKEEESNE